MKTLAVKMIIGILMGIAIYCISSFLEKKLLQKRNLEVKESKKENIVVMLLTIMAGVFTMIRFTWITEIIYVFIIITICVLVAITDLHHRIIPNELLLVMFSAKLLIGVLSLLGMEYVPKINMISSLIGFVVGFVIFMIPAFIGKSVGAGDIKLAAVTGFCLGVDGLLYSIVLMGIIVLVYEFYKKRTMLRSAMYEMIPLGPFMAISTVIVILVDYKTLMDFLIN